MAYLSLFLILVAMGALTSAVAASLMAYGLLHPPRMNDGKALWLLKRLSPTDLGMLYETVWFDVRDEHDGTRLRLAAWWIPAPVRSDRSVIFLHGYADAKVGSIAWSPLWHSLGFNILALDLRAHGESEGAICTAGYFERHDVAQVIDRLRVDRPQATRELFLFGVSLGGAVALAVAAQRDDLKGLVLDSAYANFARAARARFDRAGAPGGVFQQWALKLAEWSSNANFADVQPVELLRHVSCPVLMIQSSEEPLMSRQDVDALREALITHHKTHPRDRYWRAEEAGHLMAMATDLARYRNELREFTKEDQTEPFDPVATSADQAVATPESKDPSVTQSQDKPER